MPDGGVFDDFEFIAAMQAAKARAEDFQALQDANAGRETGHGNRHHSTEKTQSIDGKKKRARETNDAFYLALMRDGAFGGFIADEVFGGKSDSEIAEIVAEIEAKTGQSFEAYAAGILGAGAAHRVPGESDADYHRRVVTAVAAEIIDPRTGKIKAQHAGDPMADIILRDATYQSIMENVAHLNSNVTAAVADAAVSELIDDGYTSTEIAAAHVRDGKMASDLRDGQDGHRDARYGETLAIAESAEFFGKRDEAAEATHNHNGSPPFNP